MKDFEQFEKEASKRVITISKAEFIDKAAEVCSKDPSLLFGVGFVSNFVAKLTVALFDKDKTEEVKKD